MNIIKKLFGIKPEKQEEPNPENSKLNFLLQSWGENYSDANYKAVMQELMEGNAFLLLPSDNDSKDSGDWVKAQKDLTIHLTSVINLDGLKVLAAFSDEQSMVAWTKTKTPYTALKAQEVFALCTQQGIDRVVINTHQKNMYVIERNRENISTTTIGKDTKVLVGTPVHPLSRQVTDKLVMNFRKVETITEVYQYAQTLNGETSIVLGICMSVVSEHSKAALHHALNNALQGETLEQPLDIMILDNGDWLNTVRGINNSLLYRNF